MLAGEPVYGVISPTTDPVICEYIGLEGLDFYMIDAEHGAITPSDIGNLVRACEVVGLTPLARVGQLNAGLLLQFLDAGVRGIMMPGISSVADVKQLVAAIKYPPLGTRGLGPVRSAHYMKGGTIQAEYVQQANDSILVLPQIEDTEGVKNLPEILKVEGVDGFVIGPRDLAMSMGFYDGPAHAEVKAVIDDIFRQVLASKKCIGTVAGTAEQAKAIIDQGATLVLNSVQGLLGAGASRFLPPK